MYLSRIQLNRFRREAQWLLASPQRMHAAVLQCFLDPPTGDRRGDSRVLWRLDEDHNRLFLYIVSPDRPDFAYFAGEAGWPTADPGQSREYGPFLDRLTEGQRWAFRLTANPTQYVRPKDGGAAKRIAHVTVGYQEEWLIGKEDTSGFRVTSGQEFGSDGTGLPDLRVTSRSTRSFDRRETPGRVTIAMAQFDGRLEVTDAKLLRRTLVTGIGPAKAYGCGLLTLAPLP